MDYVSATRKSLIARMALSVSLLLKLLSCLVEYTLETLCNILYLTGTLQLVYHFGIDDFEIGISAV